MNYELFCGNAEFVVPILAEAPCKWLAQELIEANLAFCAETDGILTDIPAMVIEASQRSQLLLADRVEVAADGTLAQKTALRTSKSTVAT